MKSAVVRRHISACCLAIAMVVSVAVPIFSPLLQNHAAAATPTPVSTIKSTFGQDAVNVITCVGRIEQRPLTADVLKRAFNTTISQMSSFDWNYYAGSQAQPSNFNAASYSNFIVNNFGAMVNVISMYEPRPNSTNPDHCGDTIPADTATLGKPNYILIPVAGTASNPTVWAALQFIGGGGGNNGTPLATTMFFEKTTGGDGSSTVGNLIYLDHDTPGYNPTTKRIVVDGTWWPTGPVSTGNMPTTSFKDVTTIKLTYTSTSTGQPVTDTYKDPRWDGYSFYFLINSTDTNRQAMADNARDLDPATDPFCDTSYTGTPFIFLPAGGNGNGSPCERSARNLVSLDSGTPGAFQTKVGQVGRHMGDKDPEWYNYLPNGVFQGRNTTGFPHLPAAQRIDPDLTNHNVWFYISGDRKSAKTVWTDGDSNEARYIGEYPYDEATARWRLKTGPCIGVANLVGQPSPGSTQEEVDWTLNNTDCQSQFQHAVVGGLVDQTAFDNTNPNPTPGTQTTPQCTAGALTWLACPMQSWLMDLATWIDKLIIDKLLLINADAIFKSSNPSSRGFHTAWTAFRTLAYALLVILGLIMVVAQVAGFELFDAYTVRKMLPKLVIAAIIIPLLWPLLELVTYMANSSANALMELIKAPFNSLPNISKVGEIGIGVSTIIGGLGAAAVGLAIGGWGVVLALVTSMVIALLQAFFVIAARDVVFDILVIASPLAVVASIFEPFKNMFSMWRRYLTGILLSIPAVAAVLAASKIAAAVAWVAHDADNAGGNTGFFFALVFIIVGYLMFWPVLKSIDKITGQIDGLTDKLTGGIQKGLSSFRRNQFKQNWGLFKQGALNTRFGRRFGRIGERIGAAQAVGRSTGSGFVGQLFGRGRVAGQRLANYRTAINAERQKDPILAAGATRAQDDTINALIVEGLNEDQIVRRHLQIHGIGTARTAQVQAGALTQAQAEADTRDEIRQRIRIAEVNLGGSVGQAQTRLTAWKSLQASGSAFRATPNEYGNDWQAASEALYRAGASLVNDGLLGGNMDMAGDIKGFKRHDHRGASFGVVAGQAQASIDAYAAQLQQNGGDRTAIQAGSIVAPGAVTLPNGTRVGYDVITDSAIQNVSGTMMAQERDETADRYAQRILYVPRDAGGNPTGPPTGLLPEIVQRFQAAQAQGTPQGADAAQIAQRDFYQLIAQIASFHDYQAGASRGVAAELADLMDTPLPPAMLQIPGAPAILPGGGTVEQYLREVGNLYNAGVPLPDQFAAMRREGSQNTPYAQGGGNLPPLPGQPQPPQVPPQGGVQPSDRRLKTTIRAVGVVNDIQLYRFRYLFRNETYVGVMAQDLLRSHPKAVITDKNGFYRVDYAILGLRMCTIDEWEKYGTRAVKLPKHHVDTSSKQPMLK